MRVAVAADEIVGYCVTERAFFGQWFVAVLMVAEGARGHGIGAELLLDAQRRREPAKLFTSTNLSNQPMQRLLARLGWRSVGIVYGLDEGDPELFYLAPKANHRPQLRSASSRGCRRESTFGSSPSCTTPRRWVARVIAT